MRPTVLKEMLKEYKSQLSYSITCESVMFVLVTKILKA